MTALKIMGALLTIAAWAPICYLCGYFLTFIAYDNYSYLLLMSEESFTEGTLWWSFAFLFMTGTYAIARFTYRSIEADRLQGRL